MLISDTLVRRVRKFLSFLIIAAFLIVVVYTVAYENRVNDMERPAAIATSSLELRTDTRESISTNTEPLKKAPSPVKTLTPWKGTVTTLFWVGEAADADNAYITNVESYWDEKWETHYGGVDSPECRSGYSPCAFKPKENPFYFALPYAEYDAEGTLKASAKNVPWYGKDVKPLLKNRWIAVKHGQNICYGQWEDVGPNGEDDFAYVFGSGQPVNTFGEKAGLDLSPAFWKCLQMQDNDVTYWAFVDVSAVPTGPWKETVTTSGTSWGN